MESIDTENGFDMKQNSVMEDARRYIQGAEGVHLSKPQKALPTSDRVLYIQPLKNLFFNSTFHLIYYCFIEVVKMS